MAFVIQELYMLIFQGDSAGSLLNYAAYIEDDGSILENCDIRYFSGGVRPALWLKL